MNTTKESWTKKITPILVLVIAVVFAFVIFFPILWLISGTFKLPIHSYTYPPRLVPNPFTIANIVQLFQMPVPFHVFFFNSAIVSIFHVVFASIVSSMMGYALAKYDFPFKRVAFVVVLAGMLVPFDVLIIPLFLIVRDLGFTNTRAALIIPFIAHPLGAFLFRQYMIGVPDSIIESGRMEGASELRIYWQVFAPMVVPAFAAFAVLDFMESWNGFAWPLVVLHSQRNFTLPVWLNALVQDTYFHNPGLLLAAAFLTGVPAILAFIVFQRWFVSGFSIVSDK